jgi:ABC-type sugar transport system substrate-binding protein
MTLAPGTATWCHALLVLAVAALLFPDCHAQTVISDPATTTLDDNPNFEFPHKIGGMLLTEASSDNESPVRIGLLNGASLFFDTIREGFRHACEKWDLTCYVAAFVTGNSTGDRCAFRASTVERWIDELSVDGIAGLPSCSDETDDVQYINDASNRGVPFVTFDNDRPESKRIAYVGTDQFELGQTMARLLKQLRPEGGHFSLVGRKEGRTEGFMTELMKDNQREDHAHWFPTEEFQHEGDGMLGYTNAMLYYQQQTNTSAIVAFTQTPMKNENWTALVDAARHKNITYLGVDAADFQLEYLNQKYVDGLVGQSQWGMGVQMVEVLLQYLAEGKVEQEVYPTELIAYNRIPLKLPELDVDQNLVGGLKWLGITFFMIISLCSLICVGWTVVNRSAIVVNAAQPFFLIMIALGILVMSAALIPLSMNDEGDPGSLNETERVAICMGVPWLAWIGFSTGM